MYSMWEAMRGKAEFLCWENDEWGRGRYCNHEHVVILARAVYTLELPNCTGLCTAVVQWKVKTWKQVGTRPGAGSRAIELWSFVCGSNLRNARWDVGCLPGHITHRLVCAPFFTLSQEGGRRRGGMG